MLSSAGALDGGAIFARGGGSTATTLDATESTFSANVAAEGKGGALAISGAGVNVSFQGTLFIQNSANQARHCTVSMSPFTPGKADAVLLR